MRRSFPNLAPLVKPVWLGRIGYNDAWKLQEVLVEKINKAKIEKRPIDILLLLLEHNPVYTVGKRERQYTVEEERRLKDLGAEFYRRPHHVPGPGQLATRRLSHCQFGIACRHSGRRIQAEASGSEALRPPDRGDRDRDAEGEAWPGRGRSSGDHGIWIEGADRKIAAIGLRFRHGISLHGLALNCNTDMKWFKEIVPCGLEGKVATSLTQELSRKVTVEETIPALCESFAKHFECDVDLDHLNTKFTVEEVLNTL
ncbi:hypothetical protein L596_022816 [Steinernema carpocapsae]|uniref:Octanoyl-[acyl-carrier-protein]:protein N-octanoyltransferase LIPT2, mitochondrial n=1 Tax=Steinernema carpocapsae TaxID=34508 RepID=A0A4U5MPH6_STECR|nr:hypothetical protein L596_022816 [Steinernema carpocapsae]